MSANLNRSIESFILQNEKRQYVDRNEQSYNIADIWSIKEIKRQTIGLITHMEKLGFEEVRHFHHFS